MLWIRLRRRFRLPTPRHLGYRDYRVREFTRWEAAVGAIWQRTGLGIQQHIRHLQKRTPHAGLHTERVAIDHYERRAQRWIAWQLSSVARFEDL